MSDNPYPDYRVAKTYVWHNGKCFFVSTIERDSSAAAHPVRYNETMVWEYDWNTSTRGDNFIRQDAAPIGSIATHQRIVTSLFKTGKPE